ncbi:MAG: hypothetical protein HGJ93_00575 [Desulfosarcina sp.]|nr:hypothetical protein [Desulfosarcina sp.]MBC2764480.1 hypothetical protein [Desulfosarcina sp.]
MKRIILYHNDADGRCAAAIAGRDAEGKGYDQVVYLVAEYGEELPDLSSYNLETPADDIWLVDFSYPLKTMVQLANFLGSSQFVWIDHHVSAIEQLADLEKITGKLPGLRQTEHAACALTWYFCNPGEQSPWAVEYVADRDTWKFEHGNLTRYFYELYLNAEDTGPNSDWWDTMIALGHTDLNRVLTRQGAWLYDARMKGLRSTAKRFGREVTVTVGENGNVRAVKCLKVNHMPSGDMGQIIKDMGYELAWCYIEKRVNGDIQRTNTMYAGGDVDVSVIARSKGGGGHRGAAGWIEVVGHESA